ncbi:RNA-binding protein 12 [Fukomys damarensis]|uniref:RNA-binding protein 12 n=1 Tax=Fukomys damarensis TaxID=885580 RepID=A0A091DTH1_FUKDA|nr:RNA-binding protein 12 [Fukomys damarensis]
MGLKMPVPGNPAVPGIPNAGMPGAGIPSAEMPNAGLPRAGMSGVGLPGAGIPCVGIPGAGIPGVGMPTAGLPGAGGEEHDFLTVGSKEANNGPPFNFPSNFGRSNDFGPPLPPPRLGGAFGDARPGMPSVGNSGLPGLGSEAPGFGSGSNNLSGPSGFTGALRMLEMALVP